MATDYLLEGLAAAMQGFERGYTPFAQARFQDELSQRREKRKSASDLIAKRQELDMEQPYKLELEREKQKMQGVSAEDLSLAFPEMSDRFESGKTYPKSILPSLGRMRGQEEKYISGAELLAINPNLNVDANQKYSRSLLPVIGTQMRNTMEAEKLNIPGFKLEGNVRPTVGEAEKLRDAVGRLGKFKQGIGEMKEYVKKHGSYEYFGESGANMQGLATDLQLEAKELYNLGVLNGPDLMLISKAISDPASMKSIFTRGKTRQAELDRVLTQMEQRVASATGSKGYVPDVPLSAAGTDSLPAVPTAGTTGQIALTGDKAKRLQMLREKAKKGILK